MHKLGMKKCVAKAVTASLVISIALSGCGKKKAEFSDYGTLTGTNDSDSSSESGDTSDVGASETDGMESMDKTSEKSKTKKILSEQLGFEPGDSEIPYTDEFISAGKSVGMNFTLYFFDSEKIPTYKIVFLSEDDVHEAEIVEKILGETAVPMDPAKHKYLRTDEGDSQYVVECCTSIRYRNTNQFSDEAPSPWVDEKDYYYHVYEGGRYNIPYQLVVAFSTKYHEKVVCFYPKNPGDLVKNPNLKEIEITDPDGMLYISNNIYETKSYDTKTIMADRPNECVMSNDKVLDLVQEVSESELYMEVPRDSLSLSSNFMMMNYQELTEEQAEEDKKSELIFYNKGDILESDLSNAVLDGYVVSCTGAIARQPVLDDVENMSSVNALYGPSLYMVNDSGLVGCTCVSTYKYLEMVSQNADILSFKDAMEAYKKHMGDNLDLARTNIKAEQYDVNIMSLTYYPKAVSENSNEYYLIPAWLGGIERSGDVKAWGIISAVDGELIKVWYPD